VRCLDASDIPVPLDDARAARGRSIEAVQGGARGYAAMSIPPTQSRGAGAWAKYANLERVFPVLALERESCGTVFAVLGAPVPASELGVASADPAYRAATGRHQISLDGRASIP
jgi:hypothetical protein